MRSSRLFILPILLLFATAAIFGLSFTAAVPGHHDIGCPLMPGQAVVCEDSLLTHLQHWQNAFTATLVSLLALLAIAALAIPVVPLKLPDKRYERLRIRAQAPEPPPLLQELFSRGILHPKAP